MIINTGNEGEYIKQGFNFYPLGCKSSVGFVFRFFNTIFTFRWSKIRKKFFIYFKTKSKE